MNRAPTTLRVMSWVPIERPSRRSAAVAGVALIAIALAVITLGGVSDKFGTAYGDLINGIVTLGPLVVFLSVAIALAMLIAARPQRGILVIAALVPFDGLLKIIKHPPFSEGYKEMLTGYVFVWAFLSIVGQRREKLKRPRYMAPVLCYVAVGLFSAARLGGINATEGVKTSFFYLLIPVSLWWCPFTKKDRDHLITILMTTGFLTSLYGLWQQVVGAGELIKLGYEYNTDIRTTGPWLRSFSSFRQHSAFALFLTMVLLVCVPVALDQIERRRSKLFLAATPVIMLALAFTFVRSAWIAIAVGAAYLAVHRYRVLFFFAPFALVGLMVLPLGFEKGAFYSGSFQERQTSWTQNLNKAAKPLGNGIGTTGSAAEKALSVQKKNLNFYQPDNNYYKVLYELGVPGAFFFIMVLVTALLYTRDVEKQVTGTDRSFVIGTSATIVGVMIAAYTLVYFEIFPDDLFFWLLLGTVTSCIREPS
jgi:hypothetical protein